MRSLKNLSVWLVIMSIMVTILPGSVFAADNGSLEGWTVSGSGTIELFTDVVSNTTKPVLKWNKTVGESTTLSYNVGALEEGTYNISVTAKLPGDHGSAVFGITSDENGEFPANTDSQTALPDEADSYTTVSRDVVVTDTTVNQSVLLQLDGGSATVAYISAVSIQKKIDRTLLGGELLAVPNINDIPDSYVGNVNSTMLKTNKGNGWWWTETNGRNTMLANVSVNGETRKVIRFYPISNKNWGDAIIQGDINTTGSVLEAGTYECKILGKTVGSPGKVYWGMRNDVDGGMDSAAAGKDNVFQGSSGDFAWMTARFTVAEGNNGIAVFSDNTGSKSGQILVAEASVKKVISDFILEDNLIANSTFTAETVVSGGTLDGWTVSGDGRVELANATINGSTKPIAKLTRYSGAEVSFTYNVGKLAAGTYRLSVTAKLPGNQGSTYYGITSDSNGTFPENSIGQGELATGTDGYRESSRLVTVTDETVNQDITIVLSGGAATEAYISDVSLQLKLTEDTLGPELLAVPNINDVPSSYLGDVNSKMLKIKNGNGWGWTTGNGKNTQLIETTVLGETRKAIQFFPISNDTWGHAVVVGDFDSSDSVLEAGTYECKILGQIVGNPGGVYWGMRSDVDGGMETLESASDHYFTGGGNDFAWMTARFTVSGGSNGLAVYSDNTGSTTGQILIAEASVKKVTINDDYGENLVVNNNFTDGNTAIEYDGGSTKGWEVENGNIGIMIDTVDTDAKAVLKWTRTAGEKTTLKYSLGKLEAKSYRLSVKAKLLGDYENAYFGVTSDSNGSFPENAINMTQIPDNQTGYAEVSRELTVTDATVDQYFTIELDGGTSTECYISEVRLVAADQDYLGPELLAIPNFNEIDDSYVGKITPADKYLKLVDPAGTGKVGWGWTTGNREDPEIAVVDVLGEERKVLQMFPTVDGSWGGCVIQGDFNTPYGYLEAGEYEVSVLCNTSGSVGLATWGLRNDAFGGISQSSPNFGPVDGDWALRTARFTVDEASTGDNGFVIFTNCGGNDEGILMLAEASVKKVLDENTGNLIENYNFAGDTGLSDDYWSVTGSPEFGIVQKIIDGEVRNVLDVTYVKSGTTVTAQVGNIEPGTYELSVNVSSPMNSGTGALGITSDSNGSFPDNSSGQLPAYSEWTNVVRRITVNEKMHGQKVSFYVGGGDNMQHLYISDVSLRKVNDDGTYGENKVLNPDFTVVTPEYEETYVSALGGNQSTVTQGKLECDIYYSEENYEEIAVYFDGYEEDVQIFTLSAHNTLTLGKAELYFADGAGWYHLEASMDFAKSAPIYTLTTPTGRVVQRMHDEYFGNAKSLLGFSIRTIGEGADVKNITVNTADETDLPTYLGGSDFNIYADGEKAEDKQNVSVSADSIKIDFNSFSHDKAELDSAVSVTKASNGTVIPLTDTEYSAGCYTAVLDGTLEADTEYNITVDGDLKVSTGETLGGDYVFTFKTSKALVIDISGITSGGTEITEIAQLTAGAAATVSVDYTNTTGEKQEYSVLAGYYNTEDKLIGAQLIGSKSLEASVTSAEHTFDFSVGYVDGVNEIRFFIWNSAEGLVPLADEYILAKDLYTDSQVYNLVTSFNGDAGTSRGFAWTAATDHTDMVIEYAEADSLWSANKKSVAAKYEAYDGELFYKADVSGLTPGVTYVYRIGDTVDNIWSEFYKFTTEPETVDEFSFIAISDPQSSDWDGYANQQATVKAAMEYVPDMAFMLNIGDLTEHGNSVKEWNYHFDSIKGFGESVPYMAVVGNHESAYTDGSKYFSLRFNNPDNALPYFANFSTDNVSELDAKAVIENIQESVYTFEYGDAIFAVVNCSAPTYSDAMAILEPQKEFLKAEFEKTDKKWKFVMLHMGLYPAKSDRWHSRESLEAILNEFDVDVVLAGHDHIVTRTYPLKNGEITDVSAVSEITKGAGTIYNIVGSSGLKRYTAVIDTPEYAAVLNSTNASQPSYTAVKVSSDRIKVVTKQIDGTVIDEYEIVDAA